MNEQQKIIDLLKESLEEKSKLIDNYTNNQIVLLDAINEVLKVSAKSDLYNTIDEIIKKAFLKLKI